MISSLWIGFIGVALLMLVLDLSIISRRAHGMTLRTALGWTAFWIAMAMAFNIVIFYVYDQHVFGIGEKVGYPSNGHSAMAQFFTAYMVEKAMSLHNIFVIALLLAQLQIPIRYQHRVLYWEVLLAFAVRGGLIGALAYLMQHYSWAVYLLGIWLLLVALRLSIIRGERIQPQNNPLLNLSRQLFPGTTGTGHGRFIVRINGRLTVTTLFLALVVVTATDALFAADSIPAVYAVTKDPFLVFTSNVFAVLGQRALYFAMLGFMDRFHYIRISLVVMLLFQATQMMLTNFVHIPVEFTMAVIGLILAVGVLASLRSQRRAPAALLGAYAEELEVYMDMTWRQTRKLFILLIGLTMVVIGIAMIVLPGPALVVIPMGLAVLATEFVWARTLLNRLRRDAGDFVTVIDRTLPLPAWARRILFWMRGLIGGRAS